MKKRILSLLTTLVMVVGFVGVMPSVSAGALTLGDFEYSSNNDGTIDITGYNGDATELNIPSKIDGMTVTYIYADAFRWCDSIVCVLIPDSVTGIGEHAFSGCYNLESVTIPDSVTNIWDWAFSDCDSLTEINVSEDNEYYSSFEGVLYDKKQTELIQCPGAKTKVTIPDNVTSIGDYAFYSCYSLKSITIPASVKSIGDFAFEDCYNLESVIIPVSVTSIGDFAFEDCEGLTSITIPASVTEIGGGAFSGCNGLVSINVSKDNQYYSSIDGILYDKDQKTLIQCPSTKAEVSISDSVQTIGHGAFGNCSSLTSVAIPDNVTSIEYGAFSDCYNLESITIPDSVKSIENSTFSGCNNLTSIKIPDGVTRIGDSAFSYCLSLTSIAIPDSVTSIGSSAFSCCSNLTSITIPDSVISIGWSAFGYTYEEEKLDNFKIYCYSNSAGEEYAIDNGFEYEIIGKGNPFKYIVLDDGTIEIINYSISATDLTIPSEIDGMTVTSIGSSAFSDCDSLKSVMIPDSVKSIGDDAFAGCYSLTSITIPDSVKSIGGQAFDSCSSLISITIPDSVKSIGNHAFSGCDSLTDITIPSSVAEIGEGAFSSCNGLVSINVSTDNKYYSSNDGILYDKEQKILIQCPGAKTEVSSIPNSVQKIGYMAFYWCVNLTSVIIPDSVTSIDDRAFDSCPSLTSITIPDSVTSMGDGIFVWCTKLKSVTVLSREVEVTDLTFIAYNFYYYTIYCYSDANIKSFAEGCGHICVLLDGDYPLGDLSGDGKITTVDVGIINSFAKGTKEYTNEQFKLADANADGKITTVDVGLINKIAKSA